MARRSSHEAPAADQAFALVIRRIRAELGLSQEKFAERIGSARTTIGELERCERGASLAFVFRMADALGMSPSGLVRRVENVRAHEFP